MGEGTVRECGMDMDTLLYLTWRTSKDLLDSTGNSAQYSVITLWFPGGMDGGRDSQGVWDGHEHTAVFNMESQQGAAGQHRGLCSVSCGSLDGRGVWGRRDTCICMAEFPCCPPETITTLLISYPLTQSRKFKYRIHHQTTVVYVLRTLINIQGFQYASVCCAFPGGARSRQAGRWASLRWNPSFASSPFG